MKRPSSRALSDRSGILSWGLVVAWAAAPGLKQEERGVAGSIKRRPLRPGGVIDGGGVKAPCRYRMHHPHARFERQRTGGVPIEACRLFRWPVLPLICGLAKIAWMSAPPPPEIEQVPCCGLQQEDGAVHESLQGPGSLFMQDHLPWRVDEDLDIRSPRIAGQV